jgi:ABC-type polysaccharide/polyol phosphate export permease
VIVSRENYQEKTLIKQSNQQTALQELVEGLLHWEFWGVLGWHDIRQRYRRSTLGPFWLTLSMAFFVFILSIVYSRLFKMEIQAYVPFLVTGFLAWFFINAVINDACNTWNEAGAYLKEMKLPFALFTSRIVWRNFIIFLHNSIVFVGVAIYFQLNPGWNVFWIIPGLFLFLLNAQWVCLLLSIVSARYRDLAPIVGSLTQALFFVTPIVWDSKLIGADSLIIKLNIVNYFIDLVRAPLLGSMPSMLTWEVVICTTLVGWFFTTLLFVSKYKRLVFWL